MLTPWKESYDQPRQHIKKQRHYFATKVHLVKAMIFPVVMYGCGSWTIKKAECQRIDVFELWCWRRLLRVPWKAWRSNQSILKAINPEYSLEELMLKLKLQYLGHLMWRTNSWKRPWCWESLKAGGEEDNRGRDGWMAPLDGHEFEQSLGVGDGQEAWHAQSMGSQRVRHHWATKLNWSTMIVLRYYGDFF